MLVHRKMAIAFAITCTLLFSSTPAVARTPGAALPPLPEWPIIGPVLRLLGIGAEPEAEVLATPNASLPEYRIETRDDIDALREVSPDESVRVVITDEDLNRLIREAVTQTAFSDDIRVDVTFGDDEIAVKAFARADVADRLGLDVPIRLPERLDIEATFSARAENCMATFTFEEIRVNGWRAGLKPIANRIANEQAVQYWPDEACVEQIMVTDGEAAVEGYRK